jgi:ribonucleoside-diphosphate reductase alpha chain
MPKQGKKQEVYTHNQVYEETLQYFKGDELATHVWINKYCLKDSDGNYYELTPDDMHRRLAAEFARIELKYANARGEDEIYDALKGFKRLVPQGSPMFGIGNNKQIVSLSNCFVIGNKHDSYGGIFSMDEQIAQLQKRRAGVGVDISHLRPVGAKGNNAALSSTGAASFAERFSNTTREVAQGGRRGALMITMDIDHPDAEAFIDSKMESGKVTGANISLKVTDEFMQKKDNPLLDKIVHNAWKSAEPGVLFWDRVIEESIPDKYGELFETVSTNPCGEIPLCAYDSCRLFAINLTGYVRHPYTKNAHFDFDLFEKDVYLAQRLMDDIVDLELEKIDDILRKIDSDPEPDEVKWVEMSMWKKIKKTCTLGRRTGLGITGMGDMLASLNFKYGTKKASEVASNIIERMKVQAYKSSVRMALERGPFPMWSKEVEADNPFLNRLPDWLLEEMHKNGRRNIALLTIAPTGSVSVLTQTTSGIECMFMPYYTRRRKINPSDKDVRVDFVDEVGDSWMEYRVFEHGFKRWLEASGFDVEKVQNLPEDELCSVFEASPYYGATSNNVDWVEKVRMQGRVQKHIDHSISVTVNLPNDIPESTVKDVYLEAWKAGCKGCTVYRDGSRSGVLVTDKKESHKYTNAAKRPKKLPCDIVRFQNNKEKWVAVVGILDGKPYEIFTGKLENGLQEVPSPVDTGWIVKEREETGESRYDLVYTGADGDQRIVKRLNQKFDPIYWDYAKMVSAIMRHGMPPLHLHRLVIGLSLDGEEITTWKKGVSRVIKRYIPDGEKETKVACNECGSNNLEYVEGCLTCKNCGNSKCG